MLGDILYTPMPTLSSMTLVFLINFLFTIVFSCLLVQFSVQHLIKRKKSFFLFLLCSGTFIPLFGNIVSLSMIFLLHKFGKTFHQFEMGSFPQKDYSRVKAINVVALGAGWARVRLESSAFSEFERKEALISIGKKVKRETNLIYSKLVSDEMEELRICAFSLLEIQQDSLNQKINQFLQRYHKQNSDEKKAFIAKQLALLYWELVYFNLADHELRKIILDRSHFYATKALELLTKDTALWVLLANIDLQNKNYPGALKMLGTAEKLHAPHSKTYPYLAEIYFNNRHYDKVREYLSADISFMDIPKLSKIVTFWCEK